MKMEKEIFCSTVVFGTLQEKIAVNVDFTWIITVVLRYYCVIYFVERLVDMHPHGGLSICT